MIILKMTRMVPTCASLEYLFSLKSDLKMHNGFNFAIDSSLKYFIKYFLTMTMSLTMTKTKNYNIMMLGQSC